jgi:asparaginyl-tRNA synthetase
MIKKHRIREILSAGKEGDRVTVYGWVKTKRESKALAFLMLNDGSSQHDLQVICDITIPGADRIKDCLTGAAVRIEGSIVASPGKQQAWELHASNLELIGESTNNYPLQKKGHSLEFLREISHLRPRTNTFGAVFRVRNRLSFAVHEFFQNLGFKWVHTPIITANDCEGAGELFHVTTMPLTNIPKTTEGQPDFSQDFFGKHAFLTVSGQLEGEFLAQALGDIYTFGPTFRAENSNTTRHLSEFWMIEPECAFSDLEDMQNLAEAFFQHVCKAAVRDCADELSFLGQHYKNMSLERLAQLAETGFARITYTDAISTLQKAKKNFAFPVTWGIDLQTEHERYLTDEVFQRPVIVFNYPQEVKSFYMRLNDDQKTVAAMDVLVPGVGELIGGSQREERLDVLTRRMQEKSMDLSLLDWYLDLRRFGTSPHAGFGLGFERLVQYVTGIENIRDTIPCPRAPGLITH